MTDLRSAQLRAFLTVVELGSYTQAAQQLGYTEPAIHQQVKALESVFGFPLLRRSHRSIAPTRDGLRMLPQIKLAAESLTVVTQLAESIRGGQRIVVAGGRRTSPVLLIPLISRYEEAFPDVDVELHTPTPETMLAGALEGKFDICVAGRLSRTLPLKARKEHHLVVVPWRKLDEWVIVQSATGNCRASTVFAPSYYPIDERTNSRMMEHLPSGAKLKFLESDEAVRAAATAGLGLGLAPRGVVEQDLQTRRLTMVASEDGASQYVYVLHKRTSLLAPTVRHFLSFLFTHRSDAFRAHDGWTSLPGKGNLGSIRAGSRV